MVLRTPWRTTLSAVAILGTAIAPVLLFHLFEPIFYLLDPYYFLALSGLGVALVSWFLFVLLRPDLAEYGLSWLIVPLPAVVVLHVVFFPGWRLSPYPVNAQGFVTVAAGLLGIGLAYLGAHLVRRRPAVLGPVAEHKLAIILLVTLVPMAAVGVSYVDTPATEITGVDPVFSCGDDGAYPDRISDGGCQPGLRHAFAIGLAPDAQPQRVTVTTPDGLVFQRWFDGDELDRTSATVFLPAESGRTRYALGTYEVTVSSIWGEVIDRRTVEIDREPSVAVSFAGVVDRDPTRIAVEVNYTGDFWIELDPFSTQRGDVALRFDEDLTFPEDGTRTVTATVVDRRGQPVDLEPGSYDVELSFRRIDAIRGFTFDVPE